MGACNSNNSNTNLKYDNNDTTIFETSKPLHEGSIRDILYYKNQLISCSDDKTMRSFMLHDLMNGIINPIHVFNGHTKGINRVSISDTV